AACADARVSRRPASGPRGGASLPEICGANKKKSARTTEKFRQTRLDETSKIKTTPPMLQQSSQRASGDISRKTPRHRQFRERRSMTAIAIISTLHGANLCNRCGK